jgi:hypothetical protein
MPKRVFDTNILISHFHQDCLISAISDRLNLELVTEDKGLIRQRGRTRRRRP